MRLASELEQLLQESGVEICPQCQGVGAVKVGEGHVRCPSCKWKGYVRPKPRRIGRVEVEYEGGMFKLLVDGKRLQGVTELKLHWRAGEIPHFDVKLMNTEGAMKFEEAGLDYTVEQIALNPPGKRPE